MKAFMLRTAGVLALAFVLFSSVTSAVVSSTKDQVTRQGDKDGKSHHDKQESQSPVLKEHPQIPPAATGKRTNQQGGTEKSGIDWSKFLANAVGISTLGLFVIGLFGIYFVWQQFVLMQEALEESKRSNKAAEESNQLTRAEMEAAKRMFETAQRARLVVESLDFTFTDGAPTGGALTIRNAGNLSATNVRWSVILVGSPDPGAGSIYLKQLMPIMATSEWFNTLRDIIGPGATRELPVSVGIRGFPHFPPRAAGHIYLIARVQYMDGFEQERYVDACRFWSPPHFDPDDPNLVKPCVGFSGEGPVEELLPKVPSPPV